MICEFGTKQDFKRSLIEEMLGPSIDGKAPVWLVHRMNLLANMPPLSIKEIRAQFQASKNRVNPYIFVDYIR
jgi:hypothetical protein